MAKKTFSLHTLPVELVYNILDEMDVLTIFLSLRNVCLRLNTVIDSYKRYQDCNMMEISYARYSDEYLENLANAIMTNTVRQKHFRCLFYIYPLYRH
jgi:hypothetical protein